MIVVKRKIDIVIFFVVLLREKCKILLTSASFAALRRLTRLASTVTSNVFFGAASMLERRRRYDDLAGSADLRFGREPFLRRKSFWHVYGWMTVLDLGEALCYKRRFGS